MKAQYTITKHTAKIIMKKLGINHKALSGPNRIKTSKRFIETMKTRSDPYKYFAKAFQTELEHGSAGGELTNVTNDDILKTSKIVAVHLRGVEFGKKRSEWKEFPGYYDYLWDLEESGPR
jgi:hypothetical protein